MADKRTLFYIPSPTNIRSMLLAMIETRNQGIQVDVCIPKLSEEHEYNYQRTDAANIIDGMNFNVYRYVPEGQMYDILYSPYPTHHKVISQKNEIKYYVRFAYGVGGANKPRLLRQEIDNAYDYFLCLSKFDAATHSGFLKTYIMGNIKLSDYVYNNKISSDRKTVLYLPTWGSRDYSSLNTRLCEELKKLKNKYRIIVKMHYQMTYLSSEKKRHELINTFEDILDVNVSTKDIFNDADVVLSDLSSAAFDAVAADVPLALFGLGKPIYYGGNMCLHQQLVKDDIVPGTNNVNELETIIEKALQPEYFAKQQLLKKEMFPYEGRECLEAFLRFQDDLLNDRVDPWYIAGRREIREGFENRKKRMQDVVRKTEERYEKSSSWRLTAPLRAVSKWKKRRAAKRRNGEER